MDHFHLPALARDKFLHSSPKSLCHLNFQIFSVDPGLGSVTPGYVHLAESSLTYTAPQKKGNLRKDVFLLSIRTWAVTYVLREGQ